MAALIKALALEQQVFLLGKLPHAAIPLYHACFDLYCTASLSEMHSISLIEGTMAGLYALVRQDEANQDQLIPGLTGESWQNAAAFGAAVRRWAGLPCEEKAALRARTAAVARENGPHKWGLTMQSLYQKAIESHNAPHPTREIEPPFLPGSLGLGQ